jgi:hypothetical protein
MEPEHGVKDSYYPDVLRTLGAALRYDLAVTEPLPDRIEKLLSKLDEPKGATPIRQYTDNA